MAVYLKREWRLNLVVSFLIMIGSLFRVGQALLQTYSLNALIAGKMGDFFRFELLNVVLFVVLIFVLITTDYLREKAVQQMIIDLRGDITHKLATENYQHAMGHDSGTYVSWLSNDMTMIGDQGFEYCFMLVQCVFDPLFSFVALLAFHWSLVVLSLILTALLIIAPRLFQKKLRAVNLATTTTNEIFTSVTSDYLRGYPTLFAYGLTERLEEKVRTAGERLLKVKVQQAKWTAIAQESAGFINIMSQVAVAAWTGFLALMGIVSVGAINSTGNLSFKFLTAAANIGPVMVQIEALKPVFAKYELENANQTEDVNLKVDAKTPVTGNLTVENLQFAYPDKLPILKNISFQLESGQKLLLSGDSGTGKSTLLSILTGKLTDYSGSVRVDGVELRELSAQTRQQLIGYIDQTPYLFNESIRENLLLGDAYSDTELQTALTTAGLWSFVSQLPDQLATPVGEGGQLFSGGQRQRLALARGLLRHKKILLIDEGTNSLSTEAAVEIEQRLLHQLTTTVIFATHQLHQQLTQLCDQTLILTGTGAN